MISVGRALVLDRSAYERIVNDKRMTGPALLIGLVVTIVSGLNEIEPGLGTPLYLLVDALGWLFAVLAVFVAGRLLTREGNYTRTLRGLGFAQVVHVVEFLSLIPPLSSLAVFVGTLLSFVSIWMGAAAAHNTRGWRSVLLPFLALLVMVLIPLLAVGMVAGVAISLESALEQLGLFQP